MNAASKGRDTLSVSWGRDYRRHGRFYEYCIFCDDELIARKGNFTSTTAARKAGIVAANAIMEMYEADTAKH